jgi:tetratricopeptide (TPR) repeat protein
VEDRTLRAAFVYLAASLLAVIACTGLFNRRQGAYVCHGDILLTSSASAFKTGDLGTALALAEEAQHEALASDDFVLRARSLFALAGMERWIGEVDSALALVDQGLHWARRAEDPCLEVEGALIRSAVLYSLDESSISVPAVLEDSESLCAAAAIQARVALTKARYAARTGQFADARMLLQQSESTFLPFGLQAELRQERLFLTAYLLGQEGQHQEAVQTVEMVLSSDRQANARTAIVDDLWLLAKLYRAAVDLDAARDAATRALAVLAAMTPSDLTANRRLALESWLAELSQEK